MIVKGLPARKLSAIMRLPPLNLVSAHERRVSEWYVRSISALLVVLSFFQD